MGDLFPRGLLDWAGQRSGGVRRLFHEGSGRPSGAVLETPLLAKVRDWADGLANGSASAPRVLLLVGGPGNGKTEAVESGIASLDRAFGRQGALVTELRSKFTKKDGSAVPRLVSAPMRSGSAASDNDRLIVVQDASATDTARPALSPADLFLEDLEEYVLGNGRSAYLACVNRGILDDAMIAAVEGGRTRVASVVEATIRAVGMSADPVPCWPLAGNPDVAIWPMDVESLITSKVEGKAPAAAQLLDLALDETAWVQSGQCAAGDRCPHCNSREILAASEQRTILLNILHWYELASGKRWTFRDLNSLVSYLLAGAHADDWAGADPCAWAADQVKAVGVAGTSSKVKRQLAPFQLVAAQYQHALFSVWKCAPAREPTRDLRAVEGGNAKKLGSVDIIEGLIRFLSDGRRSAVPATISPHLRDICEILDPALAPPEEVFHTELNKRLSDLDVRFSQSVGTGLDYVRRHRWLTPSEVDLLLRLSAADKELSMDEVRRGAPSSAKRLQLLIRDFACRLVRRSIGVRFGLVRDAHLLRAYQGMVSGDQILLHEAVKQVEALMNDGDRFEVCLNTTFGEPLPPKGHRAVLRTLKQKVKASNVKAVNRPEAMTRFLVVGSGSTKHSVPLTFELYRAVVELEHGLLPASLPRAVVALLDTTRARLAGKVVRDGDALEDATISLGRAPETIAEQFGSFVVMRPREDR